MSVFNNPIEWANEMNVMLGKGEINIDNYLTDCANAVVYVRESAIKIEQLERDLASANARIAFLESVEGGQIEAENVRLRRELADKDKQNKQYNEAK